MGTPTFEVTATDGEARAGVLRTAHGEVQTPAFMPVGTKGTVKALDPERLRATGAAIVLANAYHLHFRPGSDTIEALGGIHRFMGWSGPVLTDSGGYQVFSLRHTIRRLDVAGVTFRSIYDGGEARFTPETVAEVQRQLGSDIAMCLDVCPTAGASAAELDRAVALTTAWARRQRDAPRAKGQLLFGITQGATDVRLRQRSVDEIVELGFDGYALGGLSVGEERTPMFDVVQATAPRLPVDQPRYFMGIGDPAGMLAVIERGIDMFDCVIPTRLGRTGTVLTRTGRMNMRNARFRRDERPLDDACSCAACRRFTRAYLRHLLTQGEALGLILLSEHNLRYLLDLTTDARHAIETGAFAGFRSRTLERIEDEDSRSS